MRTIEAQKWELRENHERRFEKYKKILELTNGHLTCYRPDGDIQISRGSKFRAVIAPLFRETKQRGVENALQSRWAKYCETETWLLEICL